MGSIGWKQEWATNKSEIVRMDKLSKLTNEVVFLYRNIAIFGQIFASFTPNADSMTTFLVEIMEPGYAFFVKHKSILKC